jgi:hypothetical protein
MIKVFIFALLSISLFTGCSDDGDDNNSVPPPSETPILYSIDTYFLPDNKTAAMLKVGETKSFKAIGKYSDGTEKDITSEATYLKANSIIVDKQNGKIGAIENGSSEFIVTLSNISSSPLSILSHVTDMQALKLSTFQMPNKFIERCPEVQAVFHDTILPIPKELIAKYTISDNNIAEVVQNENECYIKSKQSGETLLSASMNGLSTTTKLIITNDEIIDSYLEPQDVSLPQLTTEFFELTSIDSSGNAWRAHLVDLDTNNSNIAFIMNKDQLKTLQNGKVLVSASLFDYIESNTTVTVTDEILSDFEFLFDYAEFYPLQKFSPEIKGIYSNGTERNLALNTPTWSSSNEEVAIVDQNTGRVTSLSEGTTVITATIGDMSKSQEITISKDTLNSISIDSRVNPIIIPKGVVFELGVDGNFTFYDREDVSIISNLSSSNEDVASIIGVNTIVTKDYGETTITARLDDKTDTLTIKVAQDALESIDIEPKDNIISLDSNQSFYVTGRSVDGSTIVNITDLVDFSSSDTSILKFDENIAVPITAGTVTVKAVYNNLESNTTIFINN